MLTLALLVLAVGSVNAAEKRELFKEFDFSGMGSYPFYKHTDFAKTLTIADGGLKIVNPPATAVEGDKAFFVADWMIPYQGADYVAVFTYKSTVAGTANLSMDPWGAGATSSVKLAVSDVFTTAEATFKNYPLVGKDNEYGGDTHIIMNIGSLEGTIIIQKVQVYQVTSDTPETSTAYGDLKPFTPVLFTKNYGGSVESSTADAEGVYKVTGSASAGQAWDAQFWIGVGAEGPALPAGQKFRLKFEYKADNAATADTQTHSGAPDKGNAYITWHCIGDVNFTDVWKSFDQVIEIAGDMAGWQSVAFDLCHDKIDNNYYFRNISLEVPELLEGIGFSIGTSGWATFSCGKDVNLGTAKAYGAQFNGSYVELTPASELPAGEAVVIEAAGVSKYSFEVITGATSPTNNDLQVSDGTIKGNGSIYVLANKNGKVGFYKLADDVTVPAGKGYLEIAAGAPDFIGFGGETTGIETAKTVKANGEYYNLAGQRVAQPTKGLYIVNGKKVVIK